MWLGVFKSALFLGAFILSSDYTILAADIPGVNSGVNSSMGVAHSSTLDVLKEKAALSYYGIYRGSSLGHIGGALQPTVEGQDDPSSPQSIENYVTMGYKPTQDTIVGVLAHFNYFPASPSPENSGIQMLDPRFTLQHNNLVKAGNFNLKLRLFVQLPVSRFDNLKSNNQAFSVTPAVIANYDVPNTKLTLGLYSHLRGFVPNPGAQNTQTYTLVVAPNFNYQISRKVAATLWVDLLQLTRRSGTGFFSGAVNAPIDIEPGINWDVTSFLSINPVINIYPSNPTLAATSIQAFIVARAF